MHLNAKVAAILFLFPLSFFGCFNSSGGNQQDEPSELKNLVEESFASDVGRLYQELNKLPNVREPKDHHFAIFAKDYFIQITTIAWMDTLNIRAKFHQETAALPRAVFPNHYEISLTWKGGYWIHTSLGVHHSTVTPTGRFEIQSEFFGNILEAEQAYPVFFTAFLSRLVKELQDKGSSDPAQLKPKSPAEADQIVDDFPFTNTA